ncbi:hypothetical protein J6590_095764 [Homalodisca vitripennis]|nr:hypothetical protein J6590_095764 [Homalodisca vitripennis]
MDDKMSLFMSSIEFYFIQAFPEKRVRIREGSPNAKVSLTQEQIELRHFVVHWYYKTKDLSTSVERRKHYLSLKRQFKVSVREAKSSKVKHLLQTSSNKVKTVWDIVNEHRVKARVSADIPSTIKDSNGVIVRDPKDVSNLFNDFFINVSNASLSSTSLSLLQQQSSAVVILLKREAYQQLVWKSGRSWIVDSIVTSFLSFLLIGPDSTHSICLSLQKLLEGFR